MYTSFIPKIVKPFYIILRNLDIKFKSVLSISKILHFCPQICSFPTLPVDMTPPSLWFPKPRI